MTAFKLDKFGGMLPAWSSLLLPDGQADFSRDCYLFSGTLTGWRRPKLLRQLVNSAAQFVYRIPNKVSNNTVLTANDSHWMEFFDPDTTVMHTPVVQDQYHRFYWASPSTLPRYNTYDRIVAGQHDWVLGVPASGCTPGVTVSGGGDTVQEGFVSVVPGFAGGASYQAGNSVFLIPIVPTGTMLIQSVSFMSLTTDPGLHYQAVVYTDQNGAPHTLIGRGDEHVGISAGSEATGGFTNGVGVISNSTYWVGFAHDNALYLQVADVRSNSGAFSSHTYSNGPPNPINAGGPNPSWQVWANLTGASVFEARGYVYTWVTEYGEESPPSPAVVVNGWSNATWTIECFQPLPENMGALRNITHTRIYRTISNQAGMGSYFFVAEIPVTQAVYVDVRPDNEVAIGSQMTSLYWFPPPEDLQAIHAFPNGIAVGFKSNELWFSEAYRPHAWPPGYVVTTEFPIVGIGVCGQTIVVCTQGTPYIASGVNPSSMAVTKINLPEPCLHRASIVPTDTAVFYVSQNGLVQISQSGTGLNVTESWITRERWQELTPHGRIRAVKHMTSYFAFGSLTPADVMRQGFTVELSTQDQTSFTIWPQAGGHRLGFNTLTSPNNLDLLNVQLDAWTGICLLVQGGAVYYYDFTDQHPTIIPYLWRSKTFQQQARRNFEAMRVFFTVPDTTPPQVARDTSFPQLVLGPNQYAIVRVFVDGLLWTTREIRTTGELLRIISGIKGEMWQFELEGRVAIANTQIATSVKELALV